MGPKTSPTWSTASRGLVSIPARARPTHARLVALQLGAIAIRKFTEASYEEVIWIADTTILVTRANRGLSRALIEEALRRGAKRVYARDAPVLGPLGQARHACDPGRDERSGFQDAEFFAGSRQRHAVQPLREVVFQRLVTQLVQGQGPPTAFGIAPRPGNRRPQKILGTLFCRCLLSSPKSIFSSTAYFLLRV